MIDKNTENQNAQEQRRQAPAPLGSGEPELSDDAMYYLSNRKKDPIASAVYKWLTFGDFEL